MANSTKWLHANTTKWFSDKADEGVAYVSKSSRIPSLNSLAERFDDDALELLAEASTRLDLLDLANFSDEALEGAATAAEVLHRAGRREMFLEVVDGSAMTPERLGMAFKNTASLRDVEGLDDYWRFLRDNRNNTNGVNGAVYESTVAKAIQDGNAEGLGLLTRVSADGLPDANRLDTLTTSHAIQIKHRNQTGNYPLSALNGSTESALQYLDDLAQQAQQRLKTPVLILNRQPATALQDALDARGIIYRFIGDTSL